MANAEHLHILKQGVDVWNKWREQNTSIVPDLRGVELDGVNFKGIILAKADLERASLNSSNLSDAFLGSANLEGASLVGADLSRSRLLGVRLTQAKLEYARFLSTELEDADLSYGKFDGADFQNAFMSGVNICGAKLSNTNFLKVSMGYTILTNLDLSEVKNLETVHHTGPSSVGIDTLYKSHGNIPEKFLRGCGVPEEFILYKRSFVGRAIEFYSCFISYSSKDEECAKRLYNDLQSEGVRCWFAPEDLKIGERFRVRIDESIRLYDKLLLVLSESSVASEWVEKEVETAFEKEREQKKTVLFPVRLDDAVMDIKTGWAADVRKSRHIGDFREWKNHDSYRKAFERLMRDLKAEASR